MGTNKVYISTTEAIKLVESEFLQEGPSLPTVINWVKKYDLGYKFVGRWKIDKEKFIVFLRGKTDDFQT